MRWRGSSGRTVRDLADTEVHLVEDIDGLLDFREWLGQRRDWLGFDLETEGLNVGRDRIRLAQFGDYDTAWALPWDWWSGAVRELVPQYEGPIVAHNLLFDSKFTKMHGVEVPQRWAHDTLVMCHLHNSIGPAKLKVAAARYLDKRAMAGQGALEQAMKAQGWTWKTVPVTLPQYWLYGGLDTILTARLAGDLWPKIQEYKRVYEVELAALHVIRDAEVTGVRIDLDYVDAKAAELRMQLDALRPQVPFEFGKVPQDAKIIAYLQSRGAVFTKLTEKGQLSCDDDVLKALEPRFPDAAIFREYRSKYKLLASYFENFQEMNVDGILRPSVRVVGARTGRMSITEPALQTLPRGRIVRDAFIPREGNRIILCDYKQMEMRAMAAYSGDQAMIEAIRRGEDMHDFLALAAYGEGFTKEQRQTAKNAGFSKVYCAGVEKFAATAGIDVGVAAEFLARYDELFPGVQAFQDKVNHAVAERAGNSRYGWVKTILGRRLFVEKEKAYKGVNYIVQSSATADVLKMKIGDIGACGLGPYFRLPIHDEVFMEAPIDIADDVAHELAEVMTDRTTFCVPLDVDATVVDRWGDKYG